MNENTPEPFENHEEGDDPMARSIRPAEATKAYKDIEKSTLVVVAAKAKAWNNWTHVIGPFVRDRLAEARKRAGGSIRGGPYSRALEKLMGSFHPIYKKLSDNGTLSYLTKCMDDLEKVEAFRSRLPDDERPTHPMRVWKGYEASIRSTIAFDDMEDPEGLDGEEKAPRRKKANQDGISEKALLAQALHKLNTGDFIGDPEEHAHLTWEQFLSMYGNDQKTAAGHMQDYCDHLQKIIASVLAG